VGFLLFPLALSLQIPVGDIKNCNRPSTMCKYIVYTTLSSYEFRFYVFYTIETTWMIYMWAYKTVRTFLRTCNKPQSRSTDEPSIFTPFFSECATIIFRQITIALSTIQNYVLYILYVSDSESQTQYIKFSHIYSKFVHRFKQPTLHYTMISCDNTVNCKGADSKTWKFIEKYIKAIWWQGNFLQIVILNCNICY
jgi:hypothetical protein